MNVSTPHPIEELDELANSMRVNWTKAFNYHRNLGMMLLEAKKKIATGRYGPEWTIERWLLRKAGLFHDQLVGKLLVYKKLMASEEREKLEEEKEQIARDRRAKAEEKRLDAAARRAAAKVRRDREAMARAQEKLEREAAKAEAKKHKTDLKAEAKAEAKAAKAAAKAAKTAQAKQARADAAKQKRAAAAKRQIKQTGQQMAAASAPEPNQGVLDHMATEMQAGYAEVERGQATWISGTMRMAMALAMAREQFSSNRAFGKWVKENNLPGSPKDMQALVQMGRYSQEAHFILERTKRRSYELIWKQELKPRLESLGLFREDSRNNFSDEKTEAKIEGTPNDQSHDPTDTGAAASLGGE